MNTHETERMLRLLEQLEAFMAAQIDRLTASVQTLAQAVATLIERNTALSTENSTLKAQPVPEPVDLTPVDDAATHIDMITAAATAAVARPAA